MDTKISDTQFSATKEEEEIYDVRKLKAKKAALIKQIEEIDAILARAAVLGILVK